MIIISPRHHTAEVAAEKAMEFAPHVWAHARSMLWYQKMNAFDQETFRKMMFQNSPITRGLRPLGSVPLSVATIINERDPEIFNDRTGTAYFKFIKRNPQYKL